MLNCVTIDVDNSILNTNEERNLCDKLYYKTAIPASHYGNGGYFLLRYWVKMEY